MMAPASGILSPVFEQIRKYPEPTKTQLYKLYWFLFKISFSVIEISYSFYAALIISCILPSVIGKSSGWSADKIVSIQGMLFLPMMLIGVAVGIYICVCTRRRNLERLLAMVRREPKLLSVLLELKKIDPNTTKQIERIERAMQGLDGRPLVG